MESASNTTNFVVNGSAIVKRDVGIARNYKMSRIRTQNEKTTETLGTYEQSVVGEEKSAAAPTLWGRFFKPSPESSDTHVPSIVSLDSKRDNSSVLDNM